MPVLYIVQSEGLTFGGVLHGVPHDMSALIVYILVGLFIAMIVLGNRRKPHS